MPRRIPGSWDHMTFVASNWAVRCRALQVELMSAHAREADAGIARDIGRWTAIRCRAVAGVALHWTQIHLTVNVPLGRDEVTGCVDDYPVTSGTVRPLRMRGSGGKAVTAPTSLGIASWLSPNRCGAGMAIAAATSQIRRRIKGLSSVRFCKRSESHLSGQGRITMTHRVYVRRHYVAFITGNDTVRGRRLKMRCVRTDTACAGCRVAQCIRRRTTIGRCPMAAIARHRDQVNTTIDVQLGRSELA